MRKLRHYNFRGVGTETRGSALCSRSASRKSVSGFDARWSGSRAHVLNPSRLMFSWIQTRSSSLPDSFYIFTLLPAKHLRIPEKFFLKNVAWEIWALEGMMNRGSPPPPPTVRLTQKSYCMKTNFMSI